jgi:hypothetical protein
MRSRMGERENLCAERSALSLMDWPSGRGIGSGFKGGMSTRTDSWR